MKYGHFYEPTIPYYNYPYTFGYLLSLGLLAIAKRDGSEFNLKFKKFLSETGKRPVEELVYHSLLITESETLEIELIF